MIIISLILDLALLLLSADQIEVVDNYNLLYF
jgi:hypothetical protein